MAHWYYARDNEQTGPLELTALAEMLANGQVRATDLVWREGMMNWVAAGSVSELRAVIAPPPQQQKWAPPAAHPQLSPVMNTAVGAPTTMPGYWTPPPPDTRRQSGLGLASLIIGAIVVALEVACIGSATRASASARNNNGNPQMVLAGLGIMLGILLCLVGLVLGIVSLNMPRRRVLGVIGTVINGGILLLVIASVVLNMMK